jgi:nucleotide-binding universal stress UspA family protein
MQRFIAATDLSDRGDRAVHRAIQLAKDAGTKLTVITVVDEALPPPLARQMCTASEAELTRIVASFVEAAGADVDVKAILGDPALSVAGYATAENADLLVLGRHRQRPVADLFRRTTAERIVPWSARRS